MTKTSTPAKNTPPRVTAERAALREGRKVLPTIDIPVFSLAAVAVVGGMLECNLRSLATSPILFDKTLVFEAAYARSRAPSHRILMSRGIPFEYDAIF